MDEKINRAKAQLSSSGAISKNGPDRNVPTSTKKKKGGAAK